MSALSSKDLIYVVLKNPKLKYWYYNSHEFNSLLHYYSQDEKFVNYEDCLESLLDKMIEIHSEFKRSMIKKLMEAPAPSAFPKFNV